MASCTRNRHSKHKWSLTCILNARKSHFGTSSLILVYETKLSSDTVGYVAGKILSLNSMTGTTDIKTVPKRILRQTAGLERRNELEKSEVKWGETGTIMNSSDALSASSKPQIQILGVPAKPPLPSVLFSLVR